MESFQHNQVKLAVACALQAKAGREKRGVYFTDGMLLSLPGCERAYMPDGFFVSYRQLRNYCRFRRSARSRVYGILGVPSIIIEVASPSRLAEDYDDKREEYQRAGVKEFWLFRPDGAGYHFDLLTLDRLRGTPAYYRQRPEGQGGYSKVLRQYVRLLVQPTGIANLPRYVIQLSDRRSPPFIPPKRGI